MGKNSSTSLYSLPSYGPHGTQEPPTLVNISQISFIHERKGFRLGGWRLRAASTTASRSDTFWLYWDDFITASKYIGAANATSSNLLPANTGPFNRSWPSASTAGKLSQTVLGLETSKGLTANHGFGSKSTFNLMGSPSSERTPQRRAVASPPSPYFQESGRRPGW